MRQLVWLDLCSGLGGASRPALDRGWKVIRVDIDPRFKPDIVADVRALPLKPFHVDVLWASPPCTEFSKFQMRCFFPNPPDPDLSISVAVKEFIAALNPRFWWIENVRASRPWLTKMFGPLRANVPGHALWSNQMVLLPNLEPHKGSFSQPASTGKRWSSIGHVTRKTYRDANGKEHVMKPFVAHGPLRYSARNADAAKIPYEIGEAICRAVESREDAA